MKWDEYNILFHKLNLNRVAFKEVKDCSEEILTLVNAALASEREWVVLKAEEINHIFAANAGYPERMMQEVAKLLKEKNS